MNSFDLAGYDFTRCRDLGHIWSGPRIGNTPGTLQSTVRRTLRRKFRCPRCGTERYVDFEVRPSSITQIRSGYLYPEGYRVPGSDPHEVRLACRSAALIEMLGIVPMDEEEMK